jgi:hypothetical protein
VPVASPLVSVPVAVVSLPDEAVSLDDSDSWALLPPPHALRPRSADAATTSEVFRVLFMFVDLPVPVVRAVPGGLRAGPGSRSVREC